MIRIRYSTAAGRIYMTTYAIDEFCGFTAAAGLVHNERYAYFMLRRPQSPAAGTGAAA